MTKPPFHYVKAARPAERLSRSQTEEMLYRISALKAGVIGDGCLDIYWHADMKMSELSRETPHYNLPIVRESCSPGAAGNVAVNLGKLGCASVSLCTVIGDDWRGVLLKQKLVENKVDPAYISTAPGRFTPTYCKTILHGFQDARQENPRLDFVNSAQWANLSVPFIIKSLDRMMEQVDVVGVVDQLHHGVINDEVLQCLQQWGARGKTIVVDSRSRIERFKGMVVKPNALEVMRSYPVLSGCEDLSGWTEEDAALQAGMHLAAHVGKACCVTLGEQGGIWIENGEVVVVPTKPVAPPIDIVGAGDAFNAALLSVLGAGYGGVPAVQFAHLAAAVSVRELDGVGSASPEEILARYDEVDETD